MTVQDICNRQLTQERCAYCVNTPFKLLRKRPTIQQKKEQQKETINSPEWSINLTIIRKMQIKATVRYLYIGSLEWVMSSHILISKNDKIKHL